MVGDGDDGNMLVVEDGEEPIVAEVACGHLDGEMPLLGVGDGVELRYEELDVEIVAEVSDEGLVGVGLVATEMEIAVRGDAVVATSEEDVEQGDAVGAATKGDEDGA